MPDLSTRYLGLTLKNPLVPSSTPLTRDADAPLHLEDAGAAAIVMHSLFEEDVRNDERMMERFLIHPEGHSEASSHLPVHHDYDSKLDRYLAQIQRLKSRLEIPLIASLNGHSLSGWIDLGRELEAAGADALELNAWHLAGHVDETGEDVETRYLSLLSALKGAVTIPVTLKLSPFFSALPHFVRQAEAAGAAGVSLFNRFFQPDIDLEHLRVVDRAQLSSSADALLTMRWIAILRGQTSITLAASGGVHTAADVLKMLLAGADVTHLASAILLHGPTLITRVLADLSAWLVEREYASVSQLKGSLSQRNHPDPSAFARSAYLNAIDSFSPPPGVRY